jgi:hypothetical protein
MFVLQSMEWKAILYILIAERDLQVEEITFHVNNDEN